METEKRLAEYICRTNFEDIPQEALEVVRNMVLTVFGTTIAGATTMKTETLPVAIFLKFESADIYSALLFIMVLIIFSLLVLFTVRRILQSKLI